MKRLFKMSLFAATVGAIASFIVLPSPSLAATSLLDRKPMDIAARDQCVNEGIELGKFIAASNTYLFRIEVSQGGVLSWEEAQAIRERIDRELYWYTEYLNSIKTAGDAAACVKTRVDGIEKINHILRTELKYQK